MSKLDKGRECLETQWLHIMWLPDINWWKLRSLMSVFPSGKPQVACASQQDTQVSQTLCKIKHSALERDLRLCKTKLSQHNFP